MTKRVAILIGALTLGSAQSQPNSETQKLIFENEFVRVFDIRVPPGVFESKHSHGRGLTVALSDYDNETTNYPAQATTRRHTKLGEVRWAEPVTHEAKNTGATEQRAIRIELLRDAPIAKGAKPSSPDPLDSLIACKDTQRLLIENEYARVIEEKVPPGVAQSKHRHGRSVLISLRDADLEAVEYPSGKKSQRHAAFGEAGWREPVIHSVRNVGTTEMLNIRFELK